MREKISLFWCSIKEPHVLSKATKIALFVGVLLNIINQGDYIFNMEYEKIDYTKFILTFFVPFGVSIYTAITTKV